MKPDFSKKLETTNDTTNFVWAGPIDDDKIVCKTGSTGKWKLPTTSQPKLACYQNPNPYDTIPVADEAAEIKQILDASNPDAQVCSEAFCTGWDVDLGHVVTDEILKPADLADPDTLLPMGQGQEFSADLYQSNGDRQQYRVYCKPGYVVTRPARPPVACSR